MLEEANKCFCLEILSFDDLSPFTHKITKQSKTHQKVNQVNEIITHDGEKVLILMITFIITC